MGEEAEQSTQFGDSIRPGRGREREKDGQLVNTATCGDLGCNWPLTSLCFKISYLYQSPEYFEPMLMSPTQGNEADALYVWTFQIYVQEYFTY